MNSVYLKIITQLENDLEEIASEKKNNIAISESSLLPIDQCLKELKKLISTHEFNSKEEEIDFFKNQKPKVLSKFIFYAKLFKIESKRPKGTIKAQKKYFETEIQKCQEYFHENNLFYLYFKGAETGPDEQFFLRKNKNIRIQFECCGSYIDDQFTTSLDGTFAKFMAFEMLIKHFQKEIENLSQKKKLPPHFKVINSNLKWTASKVGLVELIYALGESKVLNKGKVDIVEITKVFEEVFNIQLGDVYRTFIEIKSRKLNNTKFIDTLKSNLEKRIQNSDK